MDHFSSILLEKNAWIMRFLFIYLIGGIRGRKWTISMMCYTEKLMREHRQRCLSGSWGFRPSISDKDHRSYWNKKKMPKERKDKKVKNKVSKKWVFEKWREKKTTNFFNVYVNKKKNQEIMINLEVTRKWCRSSKLA